MILPLDPGVVIPASTGMTSPAQIQDGPDQRAPGNYNESGLELPLPILSVIPEKAGIHWGR